MSHRFLPILLSLAFGCFASRPVAAAARAVDLPVVHMAWREPWGEPGAASAITRACGDTTLVDTLYLTLQAPKQHLPITGLSGTLLFEPMGGDTLDPYWHLERGDDDAGSLLVDFDFLERGAATSPWQAFVVGLVGYTRVGGRGRLDFSADVPNWRAKLLWPGTNYLCARVMLRHPARYAAGCARPMRVTWVGGRVRSTRAGSEELSFALAPLRSVTLNAPRGGFARRRLGLAMETWVPRLAPQSRLTLLQRDALLRDHAPGNPGSD
jgi:hypothetical protein